MPKAKSKHKSQSQKLDFKTALKKKIQDIITSKFDNSIELHTQSDQNIEIFVAPTNAGKTYHALKHLDLVPQGEIGAYYGPLRLLALEVYETLTARGVITSLLTGQEKKMVENSTVIAATCEMFNPAQQYHTVVLDEAQFLGECDERGAAWTNLLLNVQTKNLLICCAPQALNLLTKLLDLTNRTYKINRLERLTKLSVVKTPGKLTAIEDNTIVVAFSKNDVLELKDFLDNRGVPASVLYGNLPPEVRQRQMAHFREGITKVLVSTDCVGYGINAPAKTILFTTTEKFDGKGVGPLTPALAAQIAGRAGRFGIFEEGFVSALSADDLEFLNQTLDTKIPDLVKAYYSPSIEELEVLSKERLADKLIQWQSLDTIPKHLKSIIQPVFLEEKIKLANQLELSQEKVLGLEQAYLIINAPVTQMSVNYWLECVRRICQGQFVPAPGRLTRDITSRDTLDYAEKLIRECECHLWLGNRRQFRHCFDKITMEEVYENKLDISVKIDRALVDMKICGARFCMSCGEQLPLGSKHRICDNCYHGGY
jgi:ATP-dependent RNA helicase SUPV3L1/SUV3